MKKKGGHGGGGGGGGHDAGGGLRWLLTYADMITLLLALFIFLYSISEINSAKLSAFSSAMRAMFGIGKVPQSATSNSGGSGIQPMANAIVRLQRQLEEELQKQIEEGNIEVIEQEEGLRLRMKDKILFDLGRANVTGSAEQILKSIAKYLKTIPNAIRVEGHTDNIPIVKGGRYLSNWELSGARAANVVQYFSDQCGISPSRLSLAGYGEHKPLKPNLPLVGSAENRRVEIVVLKEFKTDSIRVPDVKQEERVEDIQEKPPELNPDLPPLDFEEE